MFLHALDPHERRAFALAAVTLVHEDGVLDPRELVLLDAVQQELELDELPEPASWDHVSAQLAGVTDGGAQRIILLELAGVSTSDAEVHEDELAVLRTIAGRWDLEEGLVGEFLEFAARAHALWEEGYRLVGGEEG